MVAKHIALTVAVGVGLALALWLRLPPRWTLLQTAGLCLLVPGFVLWTIARFQLGASFAVTAQARQLISSGIYSRIRNPIYIFGSCVIAGFILFLGHPAGLLVFLLIVPMQIWRARKEALILEANFGEQYRTYRKSTWF